jgi:3D (Asp-Asp-Asp) domain-containing protein
MINGKKIDLKMQTKREIIIDYIKKFVKVVLC